jgi:hypothetical protein
VNIIVTYIAVDGATGTRKYKTLAGAQKFAWAKVGKNPDIGTGYAVSGDGVVTLYVGGVTFDALFPDTVVAFADAYPTDKWNPLGGDDAYAAYQADPGEDAPQDPPTPELIVALAAARAALVAMQVADANECGVQFLQADDQVLPCNLPAGHGGYHDWLPF